MRISYIQGTVKHPELLDGLTFTFHVHVYVLDQESAVSVWVVLKTGFIIYDRARLKRTILPLDE